MRANPARTMAENVNDMKSVFEREALIGNACSKGVFVVLHYIIYKDYLIKEGYAIS